jgi:hypothetical protein
VSFSRNWFNTLVRLAIIGVVFVIVMILIIDLRIFAHPR